MYGIELTFDFNNKDNHKKYLKMYIIYTYDSYVKLSKHTWDTKLYFDDRITVVCYCNNVINMLTLKTLVMHV